MTITIGTWGITLGLTIAYWLGAFWWASSQDNSGYLGNALDGLFALVGAVIASLVTWLIWAIWFR